jgi:hypothetical protein
MTERPRARVRNETDGASLCANFQDFDPPKKSLKAQRLRLTSARAV